MGNRSKTEASSLHRSTASTESMQLLSFPAAQNGSAESRWLYWERVEDWQDRVVKGECQLAGKPGIPGNRPYFQLNWLPILFLSWLQGKKLEDDESEKTQPEVKEAPKLSFCDLCGSRPIFISGLVYSGFLNASTVSIVNKIILCHEVLPYRCL